MKRMKKHLFPIIISSIVVLIPLIVGGILWDKLPDEMPVHWNIQGDPDQYHSKMFAVCWVPGIFLLGHIITCFISLWKDGKGVPNKVRYLILWIFPAVSIIYSVFTFNTALGVPVDIVFSVQIFLGVIYIILGNYLPKVRQNHLFGTRVKWSLESKKNWENTNRFSAKIIFVMGIFFVISAVTGLMHVVSVDFQVPVILAVVLLAAFGSMLYSYLFYCKHKNDEDYYEK